MHDYANASTPTLPMESNPNDGNANDGSPEGAVTAPQAMSKLTATPPHALTMVKGVRRLMMVVDQKIRII